MGISLRKSGVVCGAIFASAAVALSSSAVGQAANSALVIGGISTPSMADALMSPLLGGKFKDQQRVSVKWPAQAGPMTGKGDLTLGASIAQGKTNLTTQIDTALAQLKTDEKVTVVGLSAGSLVVNEVLRELAASADAPSKDKITFVVVADSSRQKVISQTRYNANLDYTYQTAPERKYDIVVVTGEYDGMADFPDRWWNTLAIANAIAGSIFVHIPVMYADLSAVPAKNISVDVNSVGGKTTHYLVPAEKLPLVRLFPSLAKREAELKAKIDQGYSRNDVVAAATPKSMVSAAAPVALAAPVAETVTVAESAAVAAVPSSAAASLRNPNGVATEQDRVVAAEPSDEDASLSDFSGVEDTARESADISEDADLSKAEADRPATNSAGTERDSEAGSDKDSTDSEAGSTESGSPSESSDSKDGGSKGRVSSKPSASSTRGDSSESRGSSE